MVNRRRSELDIISQILSLSRNGAKKTEILYQGNLSYSQLQSYLIFLIEKNILEEQLVKKDNGHFKIYKNTKKGDNLLENIKVTLSYFE
jgi:predicted transcriptional regulator